MYYYRAALAAACSGCLSDAMRLVQCSILLQENAANAPRLLELLNEQKKIAPDVLTQLRKFANAREYKKALKIELPKTSKARTIRGLLFANMKRYRKAKEEFAQALVLDSGNNLAKQALLCCSEKKGGFIDEFLRILGN